MKKKTNKAPDKVEATIKIANYPGSERSFIVYGETKPHKELLSELGGGFNKYLKNPENPEEKIAAWIFSINNQNHTKVIDAFLMGDIDYTDNYSKPEPKK